MERLNYREIVKKLNALDKRLAEMGLNRHDRLRIHQRNLTELADASDEGRLDHIAAEISAERRREILWSFVESIEFVDAMDALQSRGCLVPAALLERALQGPADMYLETPNSNQGRNAMFEISIAGSVALTGAKPRLGGEPDVLFDFESRRIFVQCKRVLSDNAVPKRVCEATKQLGRDLSQSCEPRDCGLIAISISKAINPGDRMLMVDSEQGMADALRSEIDKVIQRHERALRVIKPPKIAGILFHIATPSYVHEHRLFTVAHSSTVYPIPGKSDAALLRNLTKILRF